MFTIGDVYLYADSFGPTVSFWQTVFELELVEREDSETAAFAVLDFPYGGPSLRILSGPGARVDTGPLFDVLATDFDATLVRALENGGTQKGEIEAYNDLRVVTVADPAGNQFDLLEQAEFEVIDETPTDE